MLTKVPVPYDLFVADQISRCSDKPEFCNTSCTKVTIYIIHSSIQQYVDNTAGPSMELASVLFLVPIIRRIENAELWDNVRMPHCCTQCWCWHHSLPISVYLQDLWTWLGTLRHSMCSRLWIKQTNNQWNEGTYIKHESFLEILAPPNFCVTFRGRLGRYPPNPHVNNTIFTKLNHFSVFVCQATCKSYCCLSVNLFVH